MGVIINEIKDKYEILLHKVNEETIGSIPMDFLISISNSLNEIGQISLEINKYYINQINKKKMEYPLYNEIKNERMISLDGYMYVIKEIKEDKKNKSKSITAYSKEKKLEKNNISVESIGFCLQSSDEENDIYSLDAYMYDETGWKFGHIDESVKYNNFSEDLLIDEISYDTESGELSLDGDYDLNEGNLELNVHNETPKMRWQESVDTSWLDFLKKNIATQFTCYVHFDNKNQLVNLYSMESFGENLNLALSYDNYIKSLEKESSSSDIVTILKLVGNEDECIVSEETVTGEDTIENYSYFIENKEMSSNLIAALNKYYEMVEERNIQWKTLRNNKLTYQTELTNKKNEEKTLIEEIKALEIRIDFYESKIGTDEDLTGTFTELLADAIIEINDKKAEEKLVYSKIRELELAIESTTDQMAILNELCKKKTATDENDNLIFNTTLLDELKKFKFSETYVDDSFYDANELIESGTNKLNIISRPTKSWTIGVEDFTRRLISNGFRKHWNGQLGLGDVICLYDNLDGTEEFVYMVGYNKNYRSKTLDLTLSNKKESEDVIRYINDYLKLAKSNNKLMKRNARLINAQKNNTINLEKGEVIK